MGKPLNRTLDAPKYKSGKSGREREKGDITDLDKDSRINRIRKIMTAFLVLLLKPFILQ